MCHRNSSRCELGPVTTHKVHDRAGHPQWTAVGTQNRRQSESAHPDTSMCNIGTGPLGQENVSGIREQRRPKKMCVEADGRKELRESAIRGSLDFLYELYFVFSAGRQRTGLTFGPTGARGGGAAAGTVSALKSTTSNPGPRPNPKITP